MHSGYGFLDSVLYPGAGRGVHPAGDLRILVLHAPGKAEILDEIERLKIALHSDSTSEEVFDELKIKL